MVSTAEDTTYTFSANDFSFTDPDSGDALASVTIETVPGAGELALSGTAVQAGAEVMASEIGGLTFTPAANGNGSPYTTFTFRVSDGTEESTSAYTMRVDVGATNDPPESADAKVSTTEDTAYTFSANDFSFTDPDSGDALASVTIETVPGAGELALSGTAVAGRAEVAVADLATLTFTPAANGNGSPYTTFTFRVSDGTDESTSAYTMRVDVGATNDPPESADGMVSTAEDTTYTFSANDFSFTDPDSGDALASVTIETVPGAGELALSGTAVQAGAEVMASEIGGLTFTPAANGNGSPYTTFTFRVSDGTDESTSAYTMRVDVGATNDPPASADGMVSTAEDTPYTFSANDFSFTDPDSGDALASVTIETVPGAGELALSGTAVAGRAEVAVADLATLTFTPAANGNGSPYTTFTFRVNDGTDESTSAYTMRVDVGATNDPPESADGMVSTAEDTTYTFSANDFSFTDPDSGDALASVTIETVPGAGELALSGTAVQAGAEVMASEIGGLTFTPAANGNGSPYTTFTFRVSDGTDESTSAYTMRVDVGATNDPPESADVKVSTTEDTAYTFSANDFSFTDPDSGDALASVTIETVPGAGELALSGTAVQAGAEVMASEIGGLTFTPAANGNGSPYTTFTFRVSDGTDESTSAYTMRVDVGATNDPPASADGMVSTAEDTPYTFSANDFSFTDPDSGDALASVTIETVPGAGELALSGTAVAGRAEVAVAALATLTFTPAANGNGSPYTTFTFRVSDGTEESTSAYTMRVDVGVTNDPPASADAKVSMAEDTVYTFSANDFSFTDPDSGDALASVTIETVPGEGELALLGTAVDAGAEVMASEIGGLTFTPAANGNGSPYTTFTFRVSDGTEESTSAYTMRVDVGVTNDPPESADAKVETAEDTTYTFSANDFSFTDPDSGDALASVTVVTLPDAGELALSGTAVQAGAEVMASEIGGLTFTPAANGNGSPYTTFTFRVSDGTEESTSAYTMRVDVGVTNDPPASADAKVSTAEDTPYTFSANDFSFTDPDSGDALASVTVVTLPDAGELALSGTAVDAGAEVMASEIGGLTFTPAANGNGSPYTTFTFRVSDGTEESTSAYTMRVDVGVTNDPPASADAKVSMAEDTVYTFSANDFSFTDPDSGDALASVTIETVPGAGELALSGTAVQAGAEVMASEIGGLTFTPAANGNGSPYTTFTFRVSDGTDESTLAYTMTVDVTTDNDPATGVPAIAGTAEVGEVLSASPGSVDDPDGKTRADNGDAGYAYAYRWFRVDADGTSNPTEIANAISATYTLTSDDVGRKVKVQVSFTDDEDIDEMRTSEAYPASGTVVGVPGEPESFEAQAGDMEVTLTWSVPASDGGSAVTGYRYRVSADGGATWNPDWTDVADGADADSDRANETTVTVTGLVNGTPYTFEVRAVNAIGGGEAAGPRTVAPTVTEVALTGVAVSSTPAARGTYVAGDAIRFTATFAAPVTVTGIPRFAFTLGAATRHAAYGSDSQSAELVFSYTVAAGDVDTDGISWAADALDLDGGTIRLTTSDPDLEADASLAHGAQSALSAHRVDAGPPGLVSATLQGTALVLLYDEALDESSEPGTDAYAVTATAGTDTTTPELSGVSVNGRKVTLTLGASPAGDATVTLAYTVPTGTDAMPVQDLSGNDAPAFTGRAVTRSARLRLEDGEAGSPEGRVEIFLDGEWGTICDDSWTDVESDTVCRLLGYEEGSVGNGGRFLEAHFGQGTGPIWLDDVNCDGNEKSLLGCEHTRYTKGQKAQCRHSEDVGVRCRPPSRPRVMEAPVLSAPGTQGWGPGEMLQVKLKFSEKVMVDTTGGMPSVEVMLGDVMRRATYKSTSETETLVFAYQIADTDGMHGKVQVMPDSLETRGGRIEGESTGRAAELAHLGASRTVPPPPPAGALTARFEKVPELHRGAGDRFSFEVHFSAEPAGLNYRSMAGPLFRVNGGAVTGARRLGAGSNLAWEVHVEPSVEGGVAVELVPTADCGAEHAVCTAAGDKLLEGVSVLVPGLPAFSVADAEVEEGPGARLDFEVTLSRASAVRVQVRFETADGTARALPAEEAARYAGEGSLEAQRDCARGGYNADYMAASGQLLFEAGVTARTVSVAVCDDGHDEGSETMRLRLTRVEVVEGIWVSSRIADGEAIGTIRNSDHMPRAWISRFGRTVGHQVVDALGERFGGGGGSRVTVGGIPLTGGGGWVGPAGEADEGARDDPFGLPEWETRPREAEAFTMTMEELMLGSAFHLSGSRDDDDSAPAFTAWGRVARDGFDAEVDDVTLGGEVTTGLVGFDAEWERVLAGVVFSQGRGEGSYRQGRPSEGDAGMVRSDLAGVYPYTRVALNARVSAWGVAGLGSGGLTLRPPGGEVFDTGLSMGMAAAGLEGRVLDAEAPGALGLDVRADVLWVRTRSDAVTDPVAGRLAGAEGEVTRLRLVLRGERGIALSGGGTFTPSGELGVRRDGGDAETGAGLEVGAGVRYASGSLTVEGRMRALLAHEESGYAEWGASGAVRFAPGAFGRGLTLELAPEWGSPGSTTQRLWAERAAGDVVAGDAPGRLHAEFGYGFGLGRARALVTPYTGLTLGDGGSRRMRLGTRWQLGADTAVGLEVTRDMAGGGESSDALALRAAVRF